MDFRYYFRRYMTVFLMKIRSCIKKSYYFTVLYAYGLMEMIMQPLVSPKQSQEGLRFYRGRGGDQANATGRRDVAIVTGGTAGIGLAVCKLLCRNDVKVIAAGPQVFDRSHVDSELEAYVRDGRLVYEDLDLGDFASINIFTSKFISTFDRLKYLINNAGVMLIPYTKTRAGFEGHIGINFLGHVYLTNRLLERFDPLIANLSSSVHRLGMVESLFEPSLYFAEEGSYSPHYAYIQSKLAIVLHTAVLSQRHDAVSIHPGVVDSGLYRNVCGPLQLVQRYLFRKIFFRSKEEAASLIVNILFNYQPRYSGAYFSNGKSKKPKFSSEFLSSFSNLVDCIIEAAS